MKTAIYIEDGETQIVLTPETKFEKDLVKGFGDKLSRVQVFEGSFYDCRGGWVRQSAYHGHSPYGRSGYGDDASLILRVGADTPESKETK